MELVDTHCHIQSAGLSEGNGERSTRELWAKAPGVTGDQIVSAAVQAQVTRLICVGCDLSDSQLAVDFAAGRPECWASIGIHPHEAAAALSDPAILPAFAALATTEKVVAIGECGLDYFYEHSPREQQLKVLKFQLDLALQHQLPVIFHVREAFDDFWPVFDGYPAGSIRGVLHSFTDSKVNLEKAVERGLYIGVNGIATFTKQPEQLSRYQAIPLNHLLLETDSPFLTPVPFRGKINEPKQIRTVADFLSELRDESLEAIAATTTANARALFDI
jgi:TatD DNase family protein